MTRWTPKSRFLESNPVTSRLTAVREKRYIVVNGADLEPVHPAPSTAPRRWRSGLRRTRTRGGQLTVRMPALVALWVAGVVLLVVSAAVAITIGPAALSVTRRVPDRRRAPGRRARRERPVCRTASSGSCGCRGWLLAAVCGAGLALCGAILQSLLRNPLADPFVLGVSSGCVDRRSADRGARRGVRARCPLSGGAFAGAVLAFGVVLVLAYARRWRNRPGGAGRGGGDSIVLGAHLFHRAVVRRRRADPRCAVLAAGLAGRGELVGCRRHAAWWSRSAWCAAWVWRTHTWTPSPSATTLPPRLGVPVRRARIVLLVVTALITAALVSAAGAIGFVGLVLPHAARFCGRGRHICACCRRRRCCGAVFMVWVDTLARTVFAPQELPTGVA